MYHLFFTIMMSQTQIAKVISEAENQGASKVDETTLSTLKTKRNFLPGVAFGSTLEFPKEPVFMYFTEVFAEGQDPHKVLKVLCSMNNAPTWLPVAKLQASQELLNQHEVASYCDEQKLPIALALHNATTMAELRDAIAGKKLIFNQSFTGKRVRQFDGKDVPATIALPKTA
jgi:hypothetical protein